MIKALFQSAKFSNKELNFPAVKLNSEAYLKLKIQTLNVAYIVGDPWTDDSAYYSIPGSYKHF